MKREDNCGVLKSDDVLLRQHERRCQPVAKY